METPGSGPKALFALNPAARPTFEVLGGRVPVLLVDDAFAEPEMLRAAALELSYQEPGTAYPGRIAQPVKDDPSLDYFLRRVLGLVNGQYLPRVPPISANGEPIFCFRSVHADFAITDMHPSDLGPLQRMPHIDPVSIFGLVYLNLQPRGGTLFFDRGGGAPTESMHEGYCLGADGEFSVVGRIEGRFNRLAIYPGFMLHSGEIEGEWIRNEERFRSPRLTLRLAFMP